MKTEHSIETNILCNELRTVNPFFKAASQAIISYSNVEFFREKSKCENLGSLRSFDIGKGRAVAQEIVTNQKLSFSDYVSVITSSSLNLIVNSFRAFGFFSLFGGEWIKFKRDVYAMEGGIYRISKKIKKPILSFTKNKYREVENKFLDQALFNKLNSFIRNHLHIVLSPYVSALPITVSYMRPEMSSFGTESKYIFVRKCFQSIKNADRYRQNEEEIKSYGSLPIIGDSTYESNFELFVPEEKRPYLARNYRIWYSVKVNKVNKELKGPVKSFFCGKISVLENILSSLIKKDIYRQHIYSDETDEAYHKYCEICKTFWVNLCHAIAQKEEYPLPEDFELIFCIHSAMLIK